MVIEQISYDFSVCKVSDYTQIELQNEYCFVGKTDKELSLVCLTEAVPSNVIALDDGWRAFRIQGELDFSLIGIFAKITNILAEQQIGIFAISTYNTDYILTKKEDYEKALQVLSEAGYEIVPQLKKTSVELIEPEIPDCGCIYG